MLKVNINRALKYISSCGSELAETAAARLEPLLYECVSPAFSYAVADIAALPPFGDNLTKITLGCTQAVLSAGTLGGGFDRTLKAVSVGSVADGLVFDALGSEYTEQYCDAELAAVAELYGYTLAMPYSPGYGDCPLSYSRVVLDYAEKYRRTGIYITAGGMMTPTKSITRISGIKLPSRISEEVLL